jgi:hypothetical protein
MKILRSEIEKRILTKPKLNKSASGLTPLPLGLCCVAPEGATYNDGLILPPRTKSKTKNKSCEAEALSFLRTSRR